MHWYDHTNLHVSLHSPSHSYLLFAPVLQNLLGRTIVVDWAVSKAKYQQELPAPGTSDKAEAHSDSEDVLAMEDASFSGSGSDGDSGSDLDEDEESGDEGSEGEEGEGSDSEVEHGLGSSDEDDEDDGSEGEDEGSDSSSLGSALGSDFEDEDEEVYGEDEKDEDAEEHGMLRDVLSKVLADHKSQEGQPVASQMEEDGRSGGKKGQLAAAEKKSQSVADGVKPEWQGQEAEPEEDEETGASLGEGEQPLVQNEYMSYALRLHDCRPA